MISPRVSVLMPVYNGERFLREAIDSILGQSFHDFELIIVDDGSTDSSAACIASYHDTRIISVKNEINQGIVVTRNRGIELARGEYIALMDCDDISTEERLAEQVAFLDTDQSVAAVAACIECVDENGTFLSGWADDRSTVTPDQIRAFLPRANCVANSSLMIRANVLRQYRYRGGRDAVEDYDLLLRLVSDGLQVAKIPAVLLCYRIVNSSFSSAGRSLPPEYRHLRAKNYFLRHALVNLRLNSFCLQVSVSLLRDAARLAVKRLFRLLLGDWPDDNRDKLALQLNRTAVVRRLIQLSALIGSLLPVVNRSGLFFFFPFFHTGGAERVHAGVVRCFHNEKPWIVFTKKSSSRDFYGLFDQGARLFNLWPICKYLYPFSVGLAAGFINRHQRPVVFGANSLFYALLLPFLKPHVRCSDLIHAFGAGVETFTLPAVPRLDCRVVINHKTRQDLQEQYEKSGLDAALAERIVLIPNCVPVPSVMPAKRWDGPLQVLFVGRGGEEKRVHLIGRTARRCCQKGLQANFILVGAGPESLESGDDLYCRVTGHIGDAAALAEIYANAHLIVIVSIREGFPLTVMEGMAQGCVPVCTAVGGIPEHIRHAENGWLLPGQDEDAVVTALHDAIVQLHGNRKLLEQLAIAAYGHAQAQFGGDRFCEQYRKVIQG
ncbi:glycosyltransferase [Trichlorobacter lovleyi]|uniref:glycosyltransferase n=1 Tax=Trichlorobacter lovleyi TaxID=313985 RepID=UPI00223F8E6E|nr:glycosyltransferase [Trichlorobacter lovleyi]QOX79703.1 glycosyltransferase [Trichlorobacter lovleyi]